MQRVTYPYKATLTSICLGTGGCFGSIPQLAYSYIQLFGLATEADYSYTSGLYGDTGDCDFDPAVTKPYATLRGFESLPKNDQVRPERTLKSHKGLVLVILVVSLSVCPTQCIFLHSPFR